MVGVLQRQFQNVYDNGRDIAQLYLYAYFECMLKTQGTTVIAQ